MAALGKTFRCRTCTFLPPAYAQLRAPWLLAGPLRLWLLDPRAMTPSSCAQLARFVLVDSAVRATLEGAELTPIPSEPARVAALGFDPTVRLAQAVARLAGRPVRMLLGRKEGPVLMVKSSSEQPSHRGSDRVFRAARARHAFEQLYVPEHEKSTRLHSRVVLVTDVVTSGATCHAAATRLSAVCAQAPRAIAIARTPP